jgi:hypothetical protein
MFSPIFICLTLHTGRLIYVNADHIVSFSKVAGNPYTYLHCLDDAPEEVRQVRETPEQIMDIINEATDFPNN